ncbi:DUF1330 domain-containing protein [Verticiella sediminum]|uniref:DUF1330 domain-containing protein n=1 Tax=Verticiella sediminum TaxID=1247510 RepID=A0A556ACL7_9BURK|nr:DUF1330 domain-containing protein [Verticiella sediminum]TSH90617.1 DUF1330 domain-containing protein [Verticiella sediminum]
MQAYAVARLRAVQFGPGIRTYLERIDATLAPYGGRFLIHGGARVVLEGGWPDDLVVIAFPGMDHARAWYASTPYQEILALRTAHARGDVMLIEGTAPGHRGIDVLPA